MTAVKTQGDTHQRERQQLSEQCGEKNKTDIEDMADIDSHMGNEEEDMKLRRKER